jgi:hypothetical protein
MATNSYRVAHANATTENLDKQSSSVHQNDVARHAAVDLTLYSVVCGTLKAAIELGVFEILAKAGASASQKSLTAKEIAEQLVRPTANGTAVNSGYLQRFLRLLASVNVVSESVAVVAAAEPGNFTSYNTSSAFLCAYAHRQAFCSRRGWVLVGTGHLDGRGLGFQESF